MECGGAVYARVPAGGLPALEAAVKAARANGAAIGLLGPTTGPYVLVDRWGTSDDMPRWAEGPDLSRADGLAALSKAVGEVVGFYEVEDGSQLGVYGAWRDGALARGLVWTEGWSAQGTPQPWEARFVARVKAEDPDQADGPDTIEDGADGPRPGVVSVGGQIWQALGAVGWGVPQPWPRRRDALK